MKEEKKTSGAKKASNNKKNYNKKPNSRPNGNRPNGTRPQNKRPHYEAKEEAPVVRKIENVKPAEDNDEDKKLIVLIAIAVLVIIGTVIGLVVGCQREEENGTDENNTNITNTTKPDKKDEITTNDDADDYEYVVKTTSSTEENKVQVSYYLDGKKVNSSDIKEGSKAKKVTPSGYENCSYYTDSEHTTAFDFSKAVDDDTKIYLVCSLKEYTVTYKYSDGDVTDEVKGSDTEKYTVRNNSKEGFLGWSKDGSQKIAFKPGQKVNLKSDLTLTPVIGDTTVVYENVIISREEENESAPKVDEIVTENTAEESVVDSEEEVVNKVEIAYTAAEIEGYSLPATPKDVGLDTPLYYIPASENDTDVIVIVSDDTEELTDKQVKLGDVEGKTPDWYKPSVSDSVKEKEYDFAGWMQDGQPVDPGWKPTTEGENVVEAAWEIKEEDLQAPEEPAQPEETPSEDKTESNNTSNETPQTEETQNPEPEVAETVNQ